jgi:hypothetical protein
MAERVDPEQARADLASGALLVCAYDSSEKCRDHHLEGSIHLPALEAGAARLPRSQEIIFYCA